MSNANPILSAALRYYADRGMMNNPKGWVHVQWVVERALASGDLVATEAETIEARAVLDTLIRERKTP